MPSGFQEVVYAGAIETKSTNEHEPTNAGTAMIQTEESQNERSIPTGNAHTSPAQTQHIVDRVTIVCTVIMAIVTTIQACFLYQSNRISSRSADMAKQSVDLARDSSEKQLQAYVLAVEGKVIGLDGNGPMKVRVTIGNFGQTPASELAVTMQEEWKDNLPPVPPKAGALVIEDGMRATLAPGENFYIEHDVKPLRQQLKDGTATLHANGTIHYKDVFGILRYETFRFVQGGKYDPSSQLMGVDGN